MPRKARPSVRPRVAVHERDEPATALVAAIALALLVVYALLVLGNMRVNVATVDEPIHLFAGYSDLRWNDRRINPEHPPLVKKLAALPLLAMKPWPSSLDHLTGEDQRAGGATFDELKQAWDLVFIDPDALRHLSHDFLYGFRGETLARHGVDDPLYLPTTEQYGKADFLNDADTMLFRARLPMLGIALLLGALIFFWSRELWGSLGALLSLALFVFDPNFIGNGGLVTTDVPLAAFMLGAIYFLWRTFRHLTLVNAAMTIVFFSLALTSKYSALLLIPIMLWLGAQQIASRREWAAGGGRMLATRRQKALGVLGLVAATVVVSWIAVWAAYGFRYSVVADPERAAKAQDEAMARRNLNVHIAKSGQYPLEPVLRRDAALQSLIEETNRYPTLDELNVRMTTVSLGLGRRLILRAGESHLLPEGFVYGFALARMGAEGRSSYLRGEHSEVGFPSYFLWTVLLKTSLIALFLMSWACLKMLRGRATGGGWFLLFPALLFFVAALGSRLNIGHRHLLPMYPFLFVAAGSLAESWRRLGQRSKRISAALVPASIISSAFLVMTPPWSPQAVYPHHLEYFNELAGGPAQGHRSLVDSNVDWGQDLGQLKRWTEAHPGSEPINLCYFGTADPRYYGLRHRNLLGGYGSEAEQDFGSAATGVLAISATNLEGAAWTADTRAEWGRFMAGRHAQPIGRVGYSMLLYQLDRKPGIPPTK